MFQRVQRLYEISAKAKKRHAYHAGMLKARLDAVNDVANAAEVGFIKSQIEYARGQVKAAKTAEKRAQMDLKALETVAMKYMAFLPISI